MHTVAMRTLRAPNYPDQYLSLRLPRISLALKSCRWCRRHPSPSQSCLPWATVARVAARMGPMLPREVGNRRTRGKRAARMTRRNKTSQLQTRSGFPACVINSELATIHTGMHLCRHTYTTKDDARRAHGGLQMD